VVRTCMRCKYENEMSVQRVSLSGELGRFGRQTASVTGGPLAAGEWVSSTDS
jgi:hypothetical protein